jgi:hypothetical protein
MPNTNGRNMTPSQHDDDQYGQGQSGYSAGRFEGDTSSNFQGRNQGYPTGYEDNSRGGDERFAGRGGSAYWQPQPQHMDYSNRGFYNQSHQQPPNPGMYQNPGSRRRHNVGNYGYGSDSYGGPSGSMFDQNQGVGMQGHFGGSYGGYGHVGSYGPEGGMQNHGNQGWQGNQSWETHQPGQQPRFTGGHRGKGPKNFQRTDERIREAVSEALEIHDDLDATHIEVLVKNGEVTLSGTVEDRHAKRLAEDVTASVSGVRDVHNQMKLAAGRQDQPMYPDHAVPDAKKARA